MDRSCAGVTVTRVLPEMLLNVADSVVVPTPTVCSAPCVPAELLTVAAALLLEAQTACVVRSCVELSENIAVAVSCADKPLA